VVAGFGHDVVPVVADFGHGEIRVSAGFFVGEAREMSDSAETGRTLWRAFVKRDENSGHGSAPQAVEAEAALSHGGGQASGLTASVPLCIVALAGDRQFSTQGGQNGGSDDPKP
jgi:hypothetical protein